VAPLLLIFQPKQFPGPGLCARSLGPQVKPFALPRGSIGTALVRLLGAIQTWWATAVTFAVFLVALAFVRKLGQGWASLGLEVALAFVGTEVTGHTLAG
jgi:hypothetical protein